MGLKLDFFIKDSEIDDAFKDIFESSRPSLNFFWYSQANKAQEKGFSWGKFADEIYSKPTEEKRLEAIRRLMVYDNARPYLEKYLTPEEDVLWD